MTEVPCTAICDQLADALIYADRSGSIVLWNPAAARLFGFSAAEAVGTSLDLIIPERLRAAHWSGYGQAMESGRTRHAGRPTRTKALHRSGSSIYVEMTFAVVTDAQGQAVGSVSIARPAPPRTAGNAP